MQTLRNYRNCTVLLSCTSNLVELTLNSNILIGKVFVSGALLMPNFDCFLKTVILSFLKDKGFSPIHDATLKFGIDIVFNII